MDASNGPELVDINDIGPAYANALASVGVRSIRDLAGWTSADLSEALGRGGHAVSAERIERNDWIGQARRLVGLASRVPAPTAPSGGVGEDDRQQACEDDRHQPDDASPAAEAGAQPAVEIADVTVTAARAPSKRSEPWLAINVDFDVRDGLTSTDETAKVAYLAEILLVDDDTGALVSIVNRYDHLQADVARYRAHAELPMPPVGRYSLETVVLLFPPIEAVTCRSGPALRISP